MAEESFQEKTEKATPKKRTKAREEGQVAKSREISSVCVIFVGMMSLLLFGAFIYTNTLTVMKHSFLAIGTPGLDMDMARCVEIANQVIGQFFVIVSPVMAAVFVAALLSNFMQVGFAISVKAIKPKFSKFNPIAGVKRLFGPNSLNEFVKSLWKLAIIGVIAYWTIKNEFKHLVPLADTSVASILIYILKIFFKMFMRAIIAMIFMAAADYAFQKWQFEKKLKMTKQEVKEEHKQTEGDPTVKSRIRSVQYQMARRRMMQEVPKADVIVTNPTHLALALQYESTGMNAPKVLAKGAGAVAQRIKEIAEDHDIPIVENKDLAQSLYKLVDIGDEVPAQFYQAVAEVLAYVYKLKGRLMGSN